MNVYVLEQEIFNSTTPNYLEALNSNYDYSKRVQKVLSSRIKANKVLDERIERYYKHGLEIVEKSSDSLLTTGKRVIVFRDKEEDYLKYGYYTYRILTVTKMEVE